MTRGRRNGSGCAVSLTGPTTSISGPARRGGLHELHGYIEQAAWRCCSSRRWLCLGLRTAEAGIVGGFATEWTQLANNLQLINSYIRQGEQLEQQILMVLDMAKNTANLPLQVFGPIMAGHRPTWRPLSKMVGRWHIRWRTSTAEFRSRFRGWGYNARTWFTDYKDWSQTSLDTTLGTLKAAGLQGQQLQSEQAVLDQLRAWRSRPKAA